MSPDESVGVAIIGLGRYALAQIMPAFAAARGCHIAALVSGNAGKAKRVAAAYGLDEDRIYNYENFGDIASDDRVDAVYIILPTGLHADWAEKAFAAEKHVLCEKPMALSATECERMIAASERAGRKLMIGYRCHFEPYNLRAMELMREKALGDLRLIRTAHQYRTGMATPAENWRLNRALAGGGPLEDYGLYGLQASLYLTGETPESLSAYTLQPKNDPRFQEIFAHASTQLRFPSGAVAQLATSYDSFGMNAVSARGAKGALVMEPATSYSGNAMVLQTYGARETLTPGTSSVQFAQQLSHFAKAVRENAVIRTPGEMGLRDIRLIEAIYKAAASGRTLALNADATLKD
ncbi:Gfo/Idh/MocA family protein [Hyphococcus luteus]|nr:Gfo/Idh/MocA family oxidoreductase [Marinicaulis flavus]